MADRRHARSVELSCECDAIAAELEKLCAEDRTLLRRECQIHELQTRRTAQLRKEQRELSGLLDGSAS
jgi:hypothetical protein